MAKTALTYAVINGNKDAVIFLLNHGAKVDAILIKVSGLDWFGL